MGTDDRASPGRPRLAAAMAEWRAALAPGSVVDADLDWYRRSTSALPRRIAAVLRPATAAAVSVAMAIAAAHRIAVWPIGSGRNWGYGTAHPVVDDCVILDLSGLDAIRVFDAELGLVTVEPGVTQGQLAAFLAQREAPFMVPTTGAGPSCSLVSNALERGFGLSPQTDHFAAVTALEAVLPDGRTYRSPLAAIGAHQSAGSYKWGCGPYLDGLFAQGNFGVVTAMTLQLARRPEASRLILFQLRPGRAVDELADTARRLMQDFPGVVGTVKITNRRLAMAMMEDYPAEALEDGVVSPDRLAAFGREQGVADWVGIICIHATQAVAVAATRDIRRRLAPVAVKTMAITRRHLSIATALDRFLPAALKRKLFTLRATFDLLDGHPNDMALRLAYWRSPAAVPSSPRDPGRDGCGILWYAPLVPIRAASVRQFVDMADRVLRDHGCEPLLTLTTVSPAAFDCTVPILFDPTSARQTEKAHACHAALLAEGLALGFAPYRLGVQAMDWFNAENPDFCGLVADLKRSVDPAGILAPGRYAPVPSGTA